MDCDVCGTDIGNGGIDVAANLAYLGEGGTVENLKLCLAECAPKVLARRRFAARAASDAGLRKPARPRR